MPKYFPLKNYEGFLIEAKPVFPRGYFPYWIGDKIEVEISFKNLEDDNNSRLLADFNLVEVHPNESYKETRGLPGMPGIADGIESGKFKTSFVSTIIGNTGDFCIYVGDKYGIDSKGLLFSTNVMSQDVAMVNIVLIFLGGIIGAVFTFITGILLGFFDVAKYFVIK